MRGETLNPRHGGSWTPAVPPHDAHLACAVRHLDGHEYPSSGMEVGR